MRFATAVHSSSTGGAPVAPRFSTGLSVAIGRAPQYVVEHRGTDPRCCVSGRFRRLVGDVCIRVMANCLSSFAAELHRRRITSAERRPRVAEPARISTRPLPPSAGRAHVFWAIVLVHRYAPAGPERRSRGSEGDRRALIGGNRRIPTRTTSTAADDSGGAKIWRRPGAEPVTGGGAFRVAWRQQATQDVVSAVIPSAARYRDASNHAAN